MTFYDPEITDAEIDIQSRHGCELTRQDVAEVLGIAPTSVWQLVRRGRIPAPSYRRPNPNNRNTGSLQALWTSSQIAVVLAKRRLAAQSQTAKA